MAGSRFRPSAGEMRRARLALATAILLAADVGRAEAPVVPDPIASATLSLRLHGVSTTASGPPLLLAQLQRPLVLALDVAGTPAFEPRRRPTLAPTLELSIETLRLFAGHTQNRISPFIGWSSNSLGLRIRF